MSTEEIYNGNKLLAEFMAFEEVGGDSFTKMNYRLPDEYRDFLHCSHFGNLHFDTSWDWIMPVCYKWDNIYDAKEFRNKFIPESIMNEYSRLSDNLDKVVTWYKIKLVYIQILDNIDWFNKHIKQNY